MINQNVMKMANDVRRMLREKQFNPGTRTVHHNNFLIRTEIAEIGQEYKRYGKARKKKLAHEAVDVAIRAFNYWHNVQFTDTDMYKCIEFYTKWMHKQFDDLWHYLEDMDALVDTTSRLNMLELIAASAVFCQYFLRMSFENAFKEKMAELEGRPPKFNTTEEHFDD